MSQENLMEGFTQVQAAIAKAEETKNLLELSAAIDIFIEWFRI